jgi:TnpA family transposase
MNLINAKYGHEPGLKAYTHVSDQFGPFATQTIPATVNEAPYILDGLLMTDAGQKIREQYADTGGFTDHVFAVTALLGFQFIPRIRDLPSKRLYLFDPASCPKELKGLIGGKIKERLITANWPDILRSAATMVAGVMPPANCCGSSQPIPGSTSWPWPCGKSDGSNGRSSSSTGCSMPTCSAAPRSASTRVRLITP